MDVMDPLAGKQERSSDASRHHAALQALAGSRLDVANLAHDYLSMIGTMVTIMQQLHRGNDPLLQHALDVTGFIAEQAEHCLAHETDMAQGRLEELIGVE